MFTYYDILQVKDDATDDEISKSYRKVARKNHPDLNQGDPEYFKLINQAYDILSSKESRAKYDSDLRSKNSSNGQDNSNGGANSHNANSSERDKTKFYPEEDDKFNVKFKSRFRDNDEYQQTGGIEQTPVEWYDYKWFEGTENYDYTERVITPRPGFYKNIAHSTIYVTLSIFAALSIMFAEHHGYWSSFFLLVGYGVAIKVWAKEKFMGVTAAPMITQGLLALISTWFIFTHSYGKLAIFMISLMNLIILVTSLTSREASSKALKERATFVHGANNAKTLKNNNVWGIAGNLDSAVGKFGSERVNKGRIGELYTDELTRMFFRIPGVKKMNGLRFLGSKEADLDHALVLGNTVIFIDSKQWSSGSYEWVNSKLIRQRKGDRIIDRTTSFADAINGYKRILPARCKIYGVILTHGTNIHVNPQKNLCDNILLANTVDGIDYIGKILTEAEKETKGFVDHTIMNLLIKNVK